jgi:hypothetical protein
LPFTVRNVPTSDGYSVETGTGEALLVTYDDLEASGWRVGMTLGL